MENGTRLRIYRRVRPTPISTAARTLAWMRDVMGGKDPGGQNDWVSLTPLVRIEPQSGGRYLIISQPPAGASDTKPTTPAALGFAYIGDSRSVRITAPKTTSATLKAFVLDAKRGTTQPVPVRVTSESLNTVSVIKAAPTQTSRLLYIVSSLPAGQSVTWECTSGP
ncbi:MAG: hypothetical protein H7145_19465 [Akkermansiaceae bacterium]|nr:hypothetical protein [Armatimonadota bacterium]